MLKRIKNEDQKRSDESARHPSLYQFPIASSLLLSGMLFPVVFPPTTSLMYDFALIASLIPFLYILRANLEAKHFRTYVIFFFFLLISKIQSIFSDTSGFIGIIIIACGAVFIYTVIPQTLRKHYNIRWKWIGVFNWLLAAILLVGIASILLGRVMLGGILIDGAGETIAIALILLYFGNWFDQLIDFFHQHASFKNMAANKARLEEFWLNWSNGIYMILLYLFLISFLRNFSLYTPVKDAVLLFFNTSRVLGDLTFTYSGISLFVLVIYLSTKISSTIKFLAEDKSFYKNQKETANIAVMLRFFLITAGSILALLVSGIPIDRITLIIGALSVGIGFGLQNIVNNLISGIILIFEKPIQVGDLVELQQYTGFVKDIGIRSSIIRTYDGAEVIVPNGNLVSQEVINWTLSNRQRRVEIRVGVAYGSDVKKVTEVLTKVLESHEKVLKYPTPAVLMDGFGDNSVDFRLLFWTSDIDNWLRTRSDLSTSIYNALDEAGISIPFPQRDLHIVSWEAPNAAIKLQGSNDPKPQTSATDSSDAQDSKISDESSDSK
jgi:small-conductance mechanosensitive channel